MHLTINGVSEVRLYSICIETAVSNDLRSSVGSAIVRATVFSCAVNIVKMATLNHQTRAHFVGDISD